GMGGGVVEGAHAVALGGEHLAIPDDHRADRRLAIGGRLGGEGKGEVHVAGGTGHEAWRSRIRPWWGRRMEAESTKARPHRPSPLSGPVAAGWGLPRARSLWRVPPPLIPPLKGEGDDG